MEHPVGRAWGLTRAWLSMYALHRSAAWRLLCGYTGALGEASWNQSAAAADIPPSWRATRWA